MCGAYDAGFELAAGDEGAFDSWPVAPLLLVLFDVQAAARNATAAKTDTNLRIIGVPPCVSRLVRLGRLKDASRLMRGA
jgi:hypothetical protein